MSRYALNENAAPPIADAAASSSSSSPHRQLIIVACRKLDKEELTILGKNFKNILVYNPLLYSDVDLTKLSFDLLLVDAANDDHHKFLELVSPQAKKLSIRIVVVKKPLCGSKKFAAALEATVIKKIENFVGDAFFTFLDKSNVPKLESQVWNCLKGCVKAVS